MSKDPQRLRVLAFVGLCILVAMWVPLRTEYPSENQREHVASAGARGDSFAPPPEFCLTLLRQNDSNTSVPTELQHQQRTRSPALFQNASVREGCAGPFACMRHRVFYHHVLNRYGSIERNIALRLFWQRVLRRDSMGGRRCLQRGLVVDIGVNNGNDLKWWFHLFGFCVDYWLFEPQLRYQSTIAKIIKEGGFPSSALRAAPTNKSLVANVTHFHATSPGDRTARTVGENSRSDVYVVGAACGSAKEHNTSMLMTGTGKTAALVRDMSRDEPTRQEVTLYHFPTLLRTVYGKNKPKIRMLKMDTEGADAQILIASENKANGKQWLSVSRHHWGLSASRPPSSRQTWRSCSCPRRCPWPCAPEHAGRAPCAGAPRGADGPS